MLTPIPIPEIAAKIVELGITRTDIATDIANQIKDSGLVDHLFDRTVTLEDICGGNIFNFFDSKDHGVIKRLLKYDYSNATQIGQGEVFLALFIKGCKKVQSDIECDSERIDVKGYGGRLCGVGGYGLGAQCSQFWQEYFQSKYKLPEKYSWNLTKSNWAVDTFGRALIERSEMTFDELINLWKQGLLKLYPKATIDDFKFVDETYQKNDLEIFKKGLLKMSLLYYFKNEGVDKLVIGKFSETTKNNQKFGNVAIISKQDIITNNHLKKISRYTLPRFEASAGIQGSHTALYI